MERDAAPSESSRRPGGAARPPCERVLVVDSEAEVLATIEELLEQGGVASEGVESPDDALEVLRRGFAPDAILLDVVASGDEYGILLEWLKENPATAAIPVVVMSTDPRTLEIAGRRADGAIEKPFDIETFLDVLGEVCLRAR